MINRLDRLYEDKLAGLTEEIEQITDAIERSQSDQKDACEVLLALRTDILKNVSCDILGTAAEYDSTDELEFREYEGLFDDFHYDIGHGKGLGEGRVDKEKVEDGFGGMAPQEGPVGDYEVDVGATTRTWEGNRYKQPSSGYY